MRNRLASALTFIACAVLGLSAVRFAAADAQWVPFSNVIGAHTEGSSPGAICPTSNAFLVGVRVAQHGRLVSSIGFYCATAIGPKGRWAYNSVKPAFMPSSNDPVRDQMCAADTYVIGFDVPTANEVVQEGPLGPSIIYQYMTGLIPHCSNPLISPTPPVPAPATPCPTGMAVSGLTFGVADNRVQKAGMYCAPFTPATPLCQTNPAACAQEYRPPSFCQHNPQACLSQQPNSGTPINIVSGTYGLNCGAKVGNASDKLAAACNGRSDCLYTIDHRVIGDPVAGCRKDYIAQWTCGSSKAIQTVSAPAEAGYGSKIFLSCH